MNARIKAVTDTMDFIRAIAAAPLPAPGHKLPQRISEAQWQQIIAVASAHLVLPAVHLATASMTLGGPDRDVSAAASEEAIDFIAHIHAANRRRNRKLHACLLNVARALNEAGIIPMALKGGAFLIDRDMVSPAGATAAATAHFPAAWRFMSDLDLLVREDRLPDAVEVVTALGYTAVDDNHDMAMDAHYPALVSPCAEVVIELHSRLFTARSAKPHPREMFEAARLIEIAGAQLYRPSRSHRIAHLIAHAQLHNRFHGAKRILARDLLDLSMLLAGAAEPLDWPAVMSNFTTPGDAHAARAFIAAWAHWQQLPADQTVAITSALDIGARDRKWAKQAFMRLHWPDWRRAAYAFSDRLALDLKRLATEPHSRRKAIAALANPARLRRNLDRRSAKLRQMLWA